MRQAIKAISTYLQAQSVPLSQAVVRLDGQYGNGTIVADLAGLAYVMRGKDYDLLDLELVQARLAQLPDQQTTHPETGTCRTLFDFPDLHPSPSGPRTRVIVATRPATDLPVKVGTTRGENVYELFYTALPPGAFAPADVVALYLHRGAFETVLSDEDSEQDPDRWCSHSAWGQECWQLISQWVWNLRLELGHQLHPDPARTTEFAPALPSPCPHAAPASGYAPPHVRLPWKAGRFSDQDFALQPDGTLRCPADQKLLPHEQRREADGSLRVVYGASIRSCRPCPLREQCQWNGTATAKPRQVSVLLHPLPVAGAPLFWYDWSRRQHRRACMQLVRDQQIEVRQVQGPPSQSGPRPTIFSRAQRARFRLSWTERLRRNARAPAQGQVSIKLFGVPDPFAGFLGLLAG